MQFRLRLLQETVGAGARQHHGKHAVDTGTLVLLAIDTGTHVLLLSLLRWGKMRTPTVAATTENVPLLK